MASKQILACHEPKKSHINIIYGAGNAFNLVERAYYYFYYFALIVIMNKRLTFMPTANFVLRSTFNFVDARLRIALHYI